MALQGANLMPSFGRFGLSECGSLVYVSARLAVCRADTKMA